MKLTDLPAELLDYVCQHLDSSSLQNVSLVDRACRSAAVPALFEIISIEPQHAPELRERLQYYLKHIRTLEIRSELPSTVHYHRETFPESEFLARFRADAQRSWSVYAQDASWLPVAELLKALPTMTDFIWACPQQFPPCLLHSLHDHLPSCRLHLRTFGLRSLVRRLEESIADPHELALVQSPNLHSIWFSYDIADTWNNPNRLPEAVSRTVQGLARSLREVRLWEKMMGAEPDYSEYAHLIRPLEDATSELPHETGHLETLHFAGPAQHLTVKAVEEWGIRTDLSAIKKLILECRVPPSVLSTLAGCRFSSLAVLSLELAIEPYHHYSTPPSDNTSKPAYDFLCSIPPLTALKLSGEIDYGYLRDVIRYHGKSLRTLHIEPMGYSSHRLSLPPQEVSWIAGHCSLIETLRLTMHRSKGDKHEVAAYSSIGNIRTLQSLALTLDASDYLSMRSGEQSEGYLAKPKERFDDFGREDANMEEYNASYDPRKGHITDMFTNAALDKMLAQSMYSTPIEARPTRSLALDIVELQSDGCGDFGTDFIPPAIALVANEIQHRWLFRRTYSSQAIALEVRELEHTNRLPTWNESTAGILNNESDESDEVSKDELDGRIDPIFRRLWPVKGDDTVWRADWHGFELWK